MIGDQPSRFNTGNLTKFSDRDIAKVRKLIESKKYDEAANMATLSVINSHRDALIATIIAGAKALAANEFEIMHILNKVIRDSHLKVDSHSRAIIASMTNPILWEAMMESDARAMDEVEKQRKEMKGDKK